MAQQSKLEETLNFRMSDTLKLQWAAFAVAALPAGGKVEILATAVKAQ